MTKTIT